MATIKKYNGSTWENTTARKYETKSEIITPPTTIYTDGTAITNYTISGNTVQSGTPTPLNPVEVQGVGERTENLFDVLDYTDIQTSINGGASNVVKTSSTISFKSNGENDYSGIYIPATYFTAHINDYDVSTTYTLSADVYTDVPCTIIFSGSATIVSIPAGTSRLSYRFSGNITLVFYIRNTTANITISKIMYAINNSTYEPYGYKIPISSGGVTTNIYLGSTQTVRQVKKYVMTGNETISNYASDFQRYVITIPTMPSMGTRLTPIICTHYIGIYDGRPVEQVPMNAVYTGSATDNSVLIKTDQTTDRSTFIAWLQEQYANGTPVTLWYVVSTPETAAVNEPLMKIGAYADTLSNATAIPTIEGANSIAVGTTVQPSEFTATWTGWHNANVKEWDGSQWNE